MFNVMSENEVVETKVAELETLVDKLSAQYKDKYAVNQSKYDAMRTRYAEMAIIANSNSGFLEIESIDPESEKAEISIALPSLDLYRGSQTHFLSGLAGATALDVTCDDEALTITVEFDNIWEKVDN